MPLKKSQAEHQALLDKVSRLESHVAQLESKLNSVRIKDPVFQSPSDPLHPAAVVTRLNRDDISRHSRQLLMPEIRVAGQLAIKNCSIILIGAGGLGSPAALYLAAAGVGRIGIVDFDVVELNNLHRQVIHNQQRIGMSKSASAQQTVRTLNSECECIAYNCSLVPENALDLLRPYDIVLDCCDNVATRYLVNDACVLLNKPLVSGSALRMEGQLTVYNFEQGPCYRCMFPTPPPAKTVTNCGDGGVLGCVPGVIGCIQAMEAIKIAMRLKNAGQDVQVLTERMLLFNGLDGTFRNIKLRQKRSVCAVCGDEPTVINLLDSYEAFCGSKACDKTPSKTLISQSRRISCDQYNEDVLMNSIPHLLIDVRQKLQFDICHLSNSVHIALEDLQVDTVKQLIDDKKIGLNQQEPQVYFICRRGNMSQEAVKKMDGTGLFGTKDIVGGLTAWAKEVDETFPMY